MGCHAAALAETQLLTQAGCLVAQTIAMLRARIWLHQVLHPSALAARSVQDNGIVGTWWQHAEDVARTFSGAREILETTRRTDEMRSSAQQRKNAFKDYNMIHILPKVKTLENAWLQEQLQASLSVPVVPYSSILMCCQGHWSAAHSRARLQHSAPDHGLSALRVQVAGIYHSVLECHAMEDLCRSFPDRQGLFSRGTQPAGIQKAEAVANAHLVGRAVARLAQVLQMDTV